MIDAYVIKLKHSFPQWIYGNISVCLKNNQGVGATILICCAIDTLSYYASANPSKVGNKKRFTQFVKKYFPSDYNPDLFYKFIRCGLVHSFNMENYFAIVCSNERWAHKLHLKKPKGFKKIIINPFVLMKHLKLAHSNFIDALLNDNFLLNAFLKAYKLKPLVKQNKTVRIFEDKFKQKNNILP